jgi:hypothetical protein
VVVFRILAAIGGSSERLTRENRQLLTFGSVFADNSPAELIRNICRTSLDSAFSASYTYYSDFEF